VRALIVGEAGDRKTALLTHVAEVASKPGSGLRWSSGPGAEGPEGRPRRCRPRGHAVPVGGGGSRSCAGSAGMASGGWLACPAVPAGKSTAGGVRPDARVLAQHRAERDPAGRSGRPTSSWVDPEKISRQICCLRAHRLAAKRVVMILHVRDEPGAPPSGRPGLAGAAARAGCPSPSCAELARPARLDVFSPPGRPAVPGPSGTGGQPRSPWLGEKNLTGRRRTVHSVPASGGLRAGGEPRAGYGAAWGRCFRRSCREADTPAWRC